MKKLFIKLLSLATILSCSSTVCFADNPLDQSDGQQSSDLTLNNETIQTIVEPMRKITFNPKRLADGPFKTWCLQQSVDTLKLFDRDELFEMWKKELDTQGSQITPEITLDFRRHEKSITKRKNYAKNRESLAYSISYKKKSKEYYEKNKDKLKAQRKAYREENKNEIQAREKAYREKNKEKILAYQKAYREENKEKLKAYYEKNKERILAQQRAYYTEHKDIMLAQQKAYYTEHKDLILARAKSYREENKEKLKVYQKAYYVEHKEQKKAYYEKNKEQKLAYQKTYCEKKKADHLLALNTQELSESSSEDMKE